MGVPKFYRWISERYPKINQIVSDNALLPEFDHLYLDMNGIIHGCTHPPDRDISDGLSERDMMLGIMHYLDRIITQIVKPKVSVYMAIDGVAPRAKLNQQRSRRFRSAKDLAEATKDQDEQTKKFVFDSNCITPGTEFLAKVSDIIRYFIRKKLKEDPAWRNLQIIFSGHDIPGEGEHKIMQHLREMRSQPNYRPNTRHCIYGQDADLIMLGLVSHEPHFTILREVVDFNFDFGQKNTLKAIKKFTKESDFQLLHLSVLREYLQIEFMHQQESVYDLERIIDDFVFMTFLVGNDFLPHMPTLDIGDGAFDLLFNIYKTQRIEWGQGHYLTESGEIKDPDRLEKFLASIGAVETEILEQREKDEAEYMKKKRRWDKRDGKEGGPSDEELKKDEDAKQMDYMTMIDNLLLKHEDSDFVDGWTPVSKPGEKDFKGRYYFEKLKLTPVDKDEHWKLRKSYMEGLRWCLAYYYRGCISWGWFYPYHYGPMLSDLTNVPKMFEEIKFPLGEPLTPFQQLMGCLPPASSKLVPRIYRWLMTSPDSPIIQFYPENFEIDMNGKKNPWEGVNLLPFIDIKLLKDSIATHCPNSSLTAVEIQRNVVGTVYCYKHDATCTDIVPSPGKHLGLPDISGSHSAVSVIHENLGLSQVTFQPKLIPGTQIPYPGFPSLNVMPIAKVELVPMGLNCFGTPSKYPNTILTMHEMPELPPIKQLAETVINKSLFVNWPMMHEGKVVAISDGTKEVRIVNGKHKVTELNKVAAERWRVDADLMAQTYFVGNGLPGSGGIQIGDVRIRLKILPLQGMRTNPSNGSTKKVFGKEEADVPLQLALWQAPAPDPRFVERGPMTLKDRFPEGCSVILTKGKYRGCLGTVVGVADKKNVGVKVQTYPAEMPFGLAIAQSVQESFVSSVDAARILKLHPGVLGKIMGRLQFDQGRYDLGLNLKSADGTCVVGYTRKKIETNNGNNRSGKDDNAWAAGDSVLVVGSRAVGSDDEGKEEERIQWEYTPKAIRLVEAYNRKFPQLFAAINKKPNEKKYDAIEVFGPKGEEMLPIVREWLDNHESAKVPRSPVTTESMSYEATAAVEKAASVRALALKKKGYPQEALIKVPGSALYREGSTGATDILSSSDLNYNTRPRLGDRIVNLCADGVPFGARGTVIAIHEAATSGSVEVVMDEEFIGGTSLQGHCSNFRGKLCLWAHLLVTAADENASASENVVQRSSINVSSSQPTSKNDKKGAQAKSSWDSQADTAANMLKKKEQRPIKSAAIRTPPRQSSTPSRVATKTPPRSSSRSGSTGRGRQGVWKEARGPDEHGIGFKGAKRGNPSGMHKWKAIISLNANTEKSKELGSDKNSNDLKKMLGVSTASKSDKTSPEKNSPKQSTDKLKAILGVGASQGPISSNGSHQAPPNPPQHPPETSVGASEGLKAILGVSSSSQTQPIASAPLHIQQRPAPQSNAADALLQLMAGKQTNMPPPQRPSGFNFTYVEEGKEPPVAPAVNMMPPSYHNYPMGAPPAMMPNNYAIAHQHQQYPLPQASAPMSDFPPLSASAATPQNSNPASQSKTSNFMVPSAVAGKGRR